MTQKLARFQNLRSLPVSTAVLDRAGRIVAVNEAWKTFGKRNGLNLPRSGVGTNYLSYCPSDGAGDLSVSLKQLLDGQREMITMIYPCDSPTQQRWFFLIGVPLSVERPSGVAILHAELTGLLPLSGSGDAKGGSNGVLGVIEQAVTETLAAQLRTMIEMSVRDEREAADATSKLSKRQLEVLRLLGEGKSNAEIAEALFRSPHTVKLHVSAILKQLNLKSRTQAALIASKLWPAPDK